jgi:glycosyltransferase involved in cell wall biosynthesis
MTPRPAHGVRSGQADIVYALPDKMGGVFNFCANLIAHRSGRVRHGAVLTCNLLERDVRSDEPMPADWQATVEHSPVENLYAALRRMHRAIDGPGALVTNDWLELATASAYPLERTVFSILHMDAPYYYDLLLRHDADIDVYVTYTEYLRGKLLELLPHRESDIMLRRYGVRIGGRRHAASGPLRLLYSGRIDRAKGVFDLPAIDARLRDAGADVVWTIGGTGPDLEALREQWTNPAIRWCGRRSMPEVLAEYEQQDVLVMPSRHEGLPVALLEAGAAGMTTVVSDLPSGIPEVVRNGETGYRIAAGDVAGFADAILRLARDRAHLEQTGGAMRDLVSREWDIVVNAGGYERLFERHAELRRPRRAGRIVPYGSRLDRRWMPNAMVRAVRTLGRRSLGGGGAA